MDPLVTLRRAAALLPALWGPACSSPSPESERPTITVVGSFVSVSPEIGTVGEESPGPAPGTQVGIPRPAVPPAPSPLASSAAHRTVSMTPARPRTPIEIEYPWIARRQGLEGEVEVEMTIGGDGAVAQCHVVKSSGHACLDEAADRALQRVGFEPKRMDGVGVPSVWRQAVRFRLDPPPRDH